MAEKGQGRIPTPMNQTSDVTTLFAPLWRRKWLILAVAIVAGVGSYLYYKREPPKYSAQTQIFLGNGAEEKAQLGSGGSGGKKAGAVPGTQAALIDSSIIKEAVRERLKREHSSAARAAMKGKVKAKAGQKSEFITINGEARNKHAAALVVNTTAQVYVKRENNHYRRDIEAAIGIARRQELDLEGAAEQSSAKGKGGRKSGSSTTTTLKVATLSSKINQLESELGISQVAQIDVATPKAAKLIGPHPKSNAIFGFVVGLLLGAFAAFLLGRLDRRLRTLAAVEGAFGTQILTVLQTVRRPLVLRGGSPAPAKSLREALWRLQTTLQVGPALEPDHNGASSSKRAARVILCLSADPGDGKSTLVASLALAQREGGMRVAVIEADFRSPVQGRLLRVHGQQGLADVLAGRLSVEEAMQEVGRPELALSATQADGSSPLAVTQELDGTVSVLVGARGVPNPPALLGRPATVELPRSLAQDYDYVLLDAPGPLQVSDAVPLLAAVDGIVLVARVGHTRENSARRLMELLERTPSAPVLGLVVNAVSSADIRRYGLSEKYGRGWRRPAARK
ncbi:MAG: Wzz/FepE/Etk N-terminal domain-containing protein [Solirubrobacteraceae bacterium]